MARQPLTLLGMVALAACADPTIYEGAFEVPITSAILQPESGGPFTEPIGFVANAHGGQIVPLALRQGRFLTDDRAVSFVQAQQLATGDDRLLGAVTVVAPPDRDEVTVFAGDQMSGELLRIPYIIGPQLAQSPTVITSTSDLPDGLSFTEGPTVTAGKTTSETWTIAWEGGAFRARGSRSGYQTTPITLDEPWSALDGRLSFTLSSNGTAVGEGAQFTIETDNGLTAIDVGGTPVAMLTSTDQSSIAVVSKLDAEPATLLWLDPDTEATTPVTLPFGADPHRLAWDESGTLLVADRARAAVYLVEPGATKGTEILLPWTVLDVAGLDVNGPDQAGGQMLYLVPADGRSLWLFDRDADAFRDVNVLVAGVQGMPFVVPVRGIEAMLHPYESTELTQDELVRRIRSVAIADHGGHVFWAHEDTGCLVQDRRGPRTSQSFVLGFDAADFERSFEDEAVSGPRLEINESNDRHVQVNQCAGLAPSERWTLQYDQARDGWTVEGDLSGRQATLATEDVRYLSDDGRVSFVIRGGSQPSQDGWRINFIVSDGVAKAIGDLDGLDGRENAVRVPGDPAYFYFRDAAPGAIDDPIPDVDWVEHDIRPFILLPGGSTNLVGRVNPRIPVTSIDGDSPEIDVTWD